MATFPWRTFPEITTPRLRLRATERDDAADIYAFRSDSEVQRYNTRPMRSVTEARALVTTMWYWYRTAQAIQWGITVLPADHVVGICGLHDWQPDARHAMLGYDLARAYWGRGLAYEAVVEVVRFGFERLDLDCIDAVTDVENGRSVRLLERLGFARVGLTHERRIDGQPQSDAMYRLTRAAWHATQAPAD